MPYAAGRPVLLTAGTHGQAGSGLGGAGAEASTVLAHKSIGDSCHGACGRGRRGVTILGTTRPILYTHYVTMVGSLVGYCTRQCEP